MEEKKKQRRKRRKIFGEDLKKLSWILRSLGVESIAYFRFWFWKIWFGKKSISFSFSDGNDDDGMCLVSPVISSPPTQSENRDQFRADYFTTSRPDVPHHFWAIAHSPDWLILTKLVVITAQKCPDYSGTA